MAFSELEFTKTWLSPSDFPTEEDSEQQVRADLQRLHDEARDGLNRLIRELQAPEAAESLGAADETGAETTVQQLLSRFTALFSGVTRLEHSLEGGEDALPTSAAVRSALDGVLLGDLSATGGGYILQNVWRRTRHTPAGKRLVTNKIMRDTLLQTWWESQAPEGDALGVTVYRTHAMTLNSDGIPVPDEVTEIWVTGGSGELGGYYWSTDETFPLDKTYFTPASVITEAVLQEAEGDENSVGLRVKAELVVVEQYAAQSGGTGLVYGDPGAFPASGYEADPTAAPYEGYLYQALGPFRQLPLLVGQGGDVTVVAPDTLLYVPQNLTEQQRAQARKNIGAAAEGAGGSGASLEETVAAVLAALPKAEEAEF